MTALARIATGSLLALAAFALPARGDGPGPAGDTPALSLGSVAPAGETAMLNVDGRSVTISGSAGRKGTLVLFICNHCPWVKAWQIRIAALGNGALDRGIGVIAINSNDPAEYPEDSPENMQQRSKDLGFRFPYVVDATSDVARAFGATHTPEAFLFDARGRLVYHGGVDDNARNEAAVKEHWLANALKSVAKGGRVATAETKTFGCGIKFRVKTAS